MKYLKFFIALIFFSILFVQCQKEVSNDSNARLTSRSIVSVDVDNVAAVPANSDCVINLDPECVQHYDTIYVTPVLPSSVGGVTIPPNLIEPGCELGGIFTYYVCPVDEFLFVEYLFIIKPECEALNDFLDGLNSEEYGIVYDYLSSYVQNQGMQIIIQDYADLNVNLITVETEVYEPSCYKVCRECRLLTDEDGGPIGGPSPIVQNSSADESSRNSIEMRGAKKPCQNGVWVFTKLKCGTGCCKTVITYTKNQYGVMVVTNIDNYSSGSCEGGANTRCWGEIVRECKFSCD